MIEPAMAAFDAWWDARARSGDPLPCAPSDAFIAGVEWAENHGECSIVKWFDDNQRAVEADREHMREVESQERAIHEQRATAEASEPEAQ